MSNQPIPIRQRLQVRPMEAAELLSMSDRQLRRLTAHGEIPSIGTGKLRRYAMADLQEWQKRNRTSCAANEHTEKGRDGEESTNEYIY